MTHRIHSSRPPCENHRKRPLDRDDVIVTLNLLPVHTGHLFLESSPETHCDISIFTFKVLRVLLVEVVQGAESPEVSHEICPSHVLPQNDRAGVGERGIMVPGIEHAFKRAELVRKDCCWVGNSEQVVVQNRPARAFPVGAEGALRIASLGIRIDERSGGWVAR